MEFGGVIKIEETLEVDLQDNWKQKSRREKDDSGILPGMTHGTPLSHSSVQEVSKAVRSHNKGVGEGSMQNMNQQINPQVQPLRACEYSSYTENDIHGTNTDVKQEVILTGFDSTLTKYSHLDGTYDNQNDATDATNESDGNTYYGFVLTANEHGELKHENEAQDDDCLVSYACSNCATTFSSPMDLWDHQRNCAVLSEFSCGICGKNFNNRTSLRKHQYIHTDEKKFLCTECGMRFNSNGNLKRHKRIHTGERPYSCEVCGKSFAQVTTLKNHMTTHTNDRPYECEVCNKRFPRKGHLTGHMGTHIDFHGGPLKLYINRPSEGNTDGSVIRNESKKLTFGAGFTNKDQFADRGVTVQSSGQTTLPTATDSLARSTDSSTATSTPTIIDAPAQGKELHMEINKTEATGSYATNNVRTLQSRSPEAMTKEFIVDIDPEPTLSAPSRPSTNATIHEAVLETNTTHSVSEGHGQEHTLQVDNERQTFSEDTTPSKSDVACNEQFTEGSVYVSYTDGAMIGRTDTSHGSPTRKTTFSPDETVIVGTIFTGNRIVNVKHFRCNVCGKILTSSNHLKEHKLIHTGSKPHRCHYCDKSFRNSGNLRRHERTHTGVRPYQCKLCAKSFTQAGTLKNHMYTHTKLKPFLCYECGEGFTRNRNLKDHVRAVHAKERPFACPFCNHRTFRQDRLNKHIDAIHGGKKGYVCSVCGRYFKTIKAMDKHKAKHRTFNRGLWADSKPRLTREWQMQKQSKLMRYVCRTCDLMFITHYYYRWHRKEHLWASKKKRQTGSQGEDVDGTTESGVEELVDVTDVSKVRNLENEVAKLKFRISEDSSSTIHNTCKQCERVCSTSGCFSGFMKCHVCVPILSCAECDKHFLLPSILKWHMKIFHKRAKCAGDYTCSICQKLFRNPSTFILHRQFHERKGNELVPGTNSNISNLIYRRKYRLAWSLVKRYSCPICSKTFSFLGKLKQHEKCHTETGEKVPLRDATTCSICNQKFSHAGALYSHMKTHASRKKRPHKCQFCHKKFLRPCHLREHVLRHAEKKFICATCNKMFYTKSSLKRHENTHKKFTCEICHEGFENEDKKRCHVQAHLMKTCTTCNEQFRSKTELDDHTLECGSEKMLYLCQLCGDSFCDIGTLEVHQKSH